MSNIAKLSNNVLIFYNTPPSVNVTITSTSNKLTFTGTTASTNEVILTGVTTPVQNVDVPNKVYVDNKANYDAIVATTGTSYTLLSTALSAGNRNIYVKSGSYVESSLVTLPNYVSITGDDPDTTKITFSAGLQGLGSTISSGVCTVVNNISSVTVSSAGSFTSVTTNYYILLGGAFYNIISQGISNIVGLFSSSYKGNSSTNLPYTLYDMKMYNISNINLVGVTTFTSIINSTFNNIYSTSNVFLCNSSGNISFTNSQLLNSIGIGLSCSSSYNVVISNCLFENNSSNALFLGSCNQFTITNNKFLGNGANCIVITGNTTNNILLTNNIIKNNVGFGIHISTTIIKSNVSGNIIITDSTVENNFLGGIVLPSGAMISNCNISFNTGIGLTAGSYCNLNNLNAMGNTVDGIFVSSTIGVIISGCNIRVNTSDGIECLNASNLKIIDCEIFGNLGYGINNGNNTTSSIFSDNDLFQNTLGIFSSTGLNNVFSGNLPITNNIPQFQYYGQNISYNTTDSTSLGTGAIIVATGGLSVNGSINTNGMFIGTTTGLFIEDISVGAPYIFYGMNPANFTCNSVLNLNGTYFFPLMSTLVITSSEISTVSLASQGVIDVTTLGVYEYGYVLPFTNTTSTTSLSLAAMMLYSTTGGLPNTANVVQGSRSISFVSRDATTAYFSVGLTSIIAITSIPRTFRLATQAVGITGASATNIMPVTSGSWWFKKIRNF